MKKRITSVFLVVCIMMSISVCMQSSITALATDPGAVLRGKGKWLFYKHATDGVNLPEYRGIHYSKDSLKKIAANVQAMKKAVRRRGAKFALVITPMKSVIYSEYMPSDIKRQSTVTRADQVVKYLKKHTKVKVVYPKDEMLAQKNRHELYFKTDTHYNQKGTFITFQEFRYQMYGVKRSIDDQKFKITQRDYAGDLAQLLGETSSYRVDNQYKTRKIPKSDKSKDHLVCFGDSYGNRFQLMAKKYMPTRFSWWRDFSMGMITSDTDIVVWQVAERYIDRLWSTHPYSW